MVQGVNLYTSYFYFEQVKNKLLFDYCYYCCTCHFFFPCACLPARRCVSVHMCKSSHNLFFLVTVYFCLEALSSTFTLSFPAALCFPIRAVAAVLERHRAADRSSAEVLVLCAQPSLPQPRGRGLSRSETSRGPACRGRARAGAARSGPARPVRPRVLGQGSGLGCT